jgi:hypothetical protein
MEKTTFGLHDTAPSVSVREQTRSRISVIHCNVPMITTSSRTNQNISSHIETGMMPYDDYYREILSAFPLFHSTRDAREQAETF